MAAGGKYEKIKVQGKIFKWGKRENGFKNGVQRPSYKKIFSTPPKYLLWKLKNVLNQRISL